MHRSPEQIRAFLHDTVEHWNEGRKDEMFAAYRRAVPGRLSIEYIGIPPLEGWAALEDMWQRWAGKVRIDVQRVMVTGNEAACYHHNTTLDSGKPPRPDTSRSRSSASRPWNCL